VDLIRIEVALVDWEDMSKDRS